jgi:hypothetical protein
MPWDAVICTSARWASMVAQMDLTDDFLARRFGGKPPPRPLLPVMPLGVTCDDFTPDPAPGRRCAGGWASEDDIACAIIARLVPHEKFDPLPLYLALARRSGRRGGGFTCCSAASSARITAARSLPKARGR